MERFLNHLYNNNQMRLKLIDFFIPEDFVAKACEFSGCIGQPVTAAHLSASRFPNKIRGLRKLPKDMTGWFPKQVIWHNNQPFLEWTYLGNHHFSEPFYEDTVRRYGFRPLNRLLRFMTPLDCLADYDMPDPVPPAGFIFHVSRCGSTLVSQMLSAVEGHRVLSEPAPIDGVLQAHFNNPSIRTAQQVEWLKKLVAVFGHRRSLSEQKLFIKLDSWHIQSLPLIRQAFPHVPFLFLVRDPIEVLVSHQKKPGILMVPGLIRAEWFGTKRADLEGLSLDAYAVWVLNTLYKTACTYRGNIEFTVINYEELPSAIWSDGTTPFGSIFKAREIERMYNVSHYYSKDPKQHFQKDSEEKQRMASPVLRSLVERNLKGSYETFLSL